MLSESMVSLLTTLHFKSEDILRLLALLPTDKGEIQDADVIEAARAIIGAQPTQGAKP